MSGEHLVALVYLTWNSNSVQIAVSISWNSNYELMHLKLFAKSCMVLVYFVPNLLVSIVQKLVFCILVGTFAFGLRVQELNFLCC